MDSTMTFNYHGSRSWCTEIENRLRSECAQHGLSPTVTPTGRGLIRQDYHVTIKGPMPALQEINQWWEKMLAAFAQM